MHSYCRSDEPSPHAAGCVAPGAWRPGRWRAFLVSRGEFAKSLSQPQPVHEPIAIQLAKQPPVVVQPVEAQFDAILQPQSVHEPIAAQLSPEHVASLDEADNAARHDPGRPAWDGPRPQARIGHAAGTPAWDRNTAGHRHAAKPETGGRGPARQAKPTADQARAEARPTARTQAGVQARQARPLALASRRLARTRAHTSPLPWVQTSVPLVSLRLSALGVGQLGGALRMDRLQRAARRVRVRGVGWVRVQR